MIRSGHTLLRNQLIKVRWLKRSSLHEEQAYDKIITIDENDANIGFDDSNQEEAKS